LHFPGVFVTAQCVSSKKGRTPIQFQLGTAAGVLNLAILLCLQGCGGATSGIPPAPPPAPTFTTIDAPGAGTQGFQGTYPTGINAEGVIAGSFYDSNNTLHAFLKNSSGILTVFDAPGSSTAMNLGTGAFGINASGTIVGSFYDSRSISHGYTRTPDGTFTLVDIPDNLMRTKSTTALSINNAGEVTGEYIDGVLIHGFVYVPGGFSGTFTVFDPPGSNAGSTVKVFGCGINDSGAVAGSILDNILLWHSFLRGTDGTFYSVDAPGMGTTANTGTQVGGMNASGAVVGTVFETVGNHSFLRAPDGTFTIFDPPGTGSSGSGAAGINDSGVIVGSFRDSNSIEHGYIRHSDGTFTIVDDPNASQSPDSVGTTITHINASGTIVGEFFDAAGIRHGYVRK
jgi:hypothetical protein